MSNATTTIVIKTVDALAKLGRKITPGSSSDIRPVPKPTVPQPDRK